MRISLVALSLLLATPCFAQGRLAWETTDHTFGSVQGGTNPSFTFSFVNTGDAPVRLQEVRAACGCTTPTYSSGEIAPGARGEVTVGYSSAGRPGRFDKSVFVRAASASGRIDLAPPLQRLLQDVARSTAASKRPFVTTFFGNPYTAMYLPELPAVLLTYDFYDRAELSAVKALAGEAAIGGRLPIALPGMFEVGAGLTRAGGVAAGVGR